jgi:DNA-binding NarL/FixJ family response regulator
VTGTTTVVFTDLVDSSALLREMGDDAYAAAFSAHLALLRAATERHHGRITKQLGDGVFALFPSASDAVAAAVEMQQTVELAGRAVDGPAFELRIGVNAGDVVESDDDVFGAVVVVARRLCDSAAGGEVLVTEVVRLLAGQRLGTTFEHTGARVLKGVASPVDAYRVPWDALPEVTRLRVIAADDAPLVRSGIVSVLTDGGFVVVADVGDADALVAAVDADPPDLVVTDIRMPPTHSDDGLRAAADIRARHPGVAVLVLSQHVEARAAASLLDGRPAGLGYLLKERVSALDEFLDACRHVAAGGSVIDPLVTEQLLRRRRHDDVLARLTDRERQVLGLMAQGRSNAAIAAELVLGAKTVETHVRSIFQKLDLEESPEGSRRVQAVLRWLQPPP